MNGYAAGGLVSGDPVRVTLRRVGQTPAGECLYSFRGGPPELVIRPGDSRAAREFLSRLNRPR